MKVDLQMRIEQISKGKVPPGYKKIKSHIVPCEWDVFPISEVCEVVSGGTPSTKKSEYWDGEIPWCTPTDITKSSKYISTTEKKITEEGLKNSSAVLLPKNSVLMCSRATIGPRAINTVKMATNQGFKSFICDKTKLDYEFFYYLLEMYVPLFKKLGSGSTFLEISKKDVEETKIIIPVSIKEQRGIAEILSTWDKAIELKEKLIEQKKELKKGLMQKLLTGEVRLPGFEGKWKKVKLKEISVCLDNLRKPINSKEREKMKGNIPYYGANGIVDYVNDYLFDEPLILMAEDGGHFNEFRHRPIAMKIEGKTWVNNHAHVLRIINSDHDFVYYSLVHKDIRKYINGSTRGKLTQSDMLAIELILPDSIEEQKAISHILMKIDLNIELLEKELKELKYQKKGLMQLLLTGKVRVKV